MARAVLGSALYLGAVGLLGLGLGALLRSTAGAVAGLFGVLFAPQLLAGLLPAACPDRIYPYLPVPAGVAVTAVRPDPAALALERVRRALPLRRRRAGLRRLAAAPP